MKIKISFRKCFLANLLWLCGGVMFIVIPFTHYALLDWVEWIYPASSSLWIITGGMVVGTMWLIEGVQKEK